MTKERSESFKRYTTEKGSIFMNDPEYKHYLRLPYLVQSLDKDDQLLEKLLSNDFPIKLMEESMEEIDGVIFYVSKVTKNRSFLTKAFEYNVRNNGAYNNETIRKLYEKVKDNIEVYQPEVDKLQQEIEDTEILSARVEKRYDETREDLIQEVMAVENKHMYIKPMSFSIPPLTQVTVSEKYLNWQYLELAERMFELRRKIQAEAKPEPTKRAGELTKEMHLVDWEKIRRAITKPSTREDTI